MLASCSRSRSSQVDNFRAAVHGLRNRLFQKVVSFFEHQLCIALVRVPPKTGPDFAPPVFLKTETMVGHFRGRDLGPNMYKESFVCIRFAKNRLWPTLVVFCACCETVRPEPSRSYRRESTCSLICSCVRGSGGGACVLPETCHEAMGSRNLGSLLKKIFQSNFGHSPSSSCVMQTIAPRSFLGLFSS